MEYPGSASVRKDFTNEETTIYVKPPASLLKLFVIKTFEKQSAPSDIARCMTFNKKETKPIKSRLEIGKNFNLDSLHRKYRNKAIFS